MDKDLQSLRVHVITYGCQMNVFDTERIIEALASVGYAATEDPAQADLILVNTCSVRAQPEQKVFGTLTRLLPLKTANPRLRFGVCGCMAQQHGQDLLRRMPYADLVFGPDNIGDLPDLIAAVQRGERVAKTTRMDRAGYAFMPVDSRAARGPCAFLTIMKGCDNVCSYCIVPRVRGREVSKPPALVIEEASRLVQAGVREITLLGQNVNSYGHDSPGSGGFVALLEAVDAIPGLARLRFVTSHPADADAAMIAAFGRLPRLAEALHLPVQSGSDRILAAMRRRYTAAEYLEKVAALRQRCPDIALSTDVIVGYPGETEDDFRATLEVVEAAQFDAMFSFKYSPRPGTPAAREPDTCSASDKAARLKTLQMLQDAITRERMQRFLGRTEEVLVEGMSAWARKGDRGGEWTGRTRTNWVVNFATSGPGDLRPGDLIPVRIDTIMAHCLRGSHEAA